MLHGAAIYPVHMAAIVVDVELVEAVVASGGFCPLAWVQPHLLQSILAGVWPWDVTGASGPILGAGTERHGGGSACALTDVAGTGPVGLPGAAGDPAPAQAAMSSIASAAPTVSGVR